MTKHSAYLWTLAGLYFLLVLVWTFNGLWLAIGRRLLPDTPGLVGTGVFLGLALLMLYLPDHKIFHSYRADAGHAKYFPMVVVAFYLVQYHFGQSQPPLADTLVFAVNLLVAGLIFMAWLRGWNWLAGGMFLGLVLQIMLYYFRAMPFEDVPAMLHWVQQANWNLLAGRNPYAEGNLNYLPGLWLPYGMMSAFQLDLRWFNLIAFPILGAGLLTAARKLFGSQASGRFHLANAVCIIFLLNPGVLQEVVKDQVMPDLMYMTVFVLGLVFSHPGLSALGLGLSLAARQTSLILLPLAFATFLRMLKNGIRYIFVILLTMAIFVLPFLFWNAQAFGYWIFVFNQQWYIDRWLMDRAQANAISLASPFFVTQVAHWLQVLQAVAVGMLTLIFSFGKMEPTSVIIRRFIIVYIVFLLLNPVIWNYYYLQVFLLMLGFLFAKFHESQAVFKNAI